MQQSVKALHLDTSKEAQLMSGNHSKGAFWVLFISKAMSTQ